MVRASCPSTASPSLRAPVTDRVDVLQGTLSLIVLRTLDALGPNHGFGIARQIEATSRQMLQINYGTLYPALLKLEQQGYIKGEWRASDNNRRARYYTITRAGKRQVGKEAQQWKQTTQIMDWFLAPAMPRP